MDICLWVMFPPNVCPMTFYLPPLSTQSSENGLNHCQKQKNNWLCFPLLTLTSPYFLKTRNPVALSVTQLGAKIQSQDPGLGREGLILLLCQLGNSFMFPMKELLGLDKFSSPVQINHQVPLLSNAWRPQGGNEAVNSSYLQSRLKTPDVC